MRGLELIVLGYDDNPNRMFRTYLAYLREHGLRPLGIILMRFAGRSPRFRAARRLLGEPRARELLRWSRQRVTRMADATLVRQIQGEDCALPQLFGPLDFSAFADSFQEAWFENLSDPSLAALLERQPCRTFLYTGGGRVPDSLLGMRGARFLHCHPGVVPEVRGADGFFWSLLQRGRPGASCFYMNEGIDTGEIVATRDFERPIFEVDLARWGHDAVYRAIVQCYAATLRAKLLVEVLSSGGDPGRLASRPQRGGEGRTFFRMHTRIRDRIIEQLVTSPRA